MTPRSSADLPEKPPPPPAPDVRPDPDPSELERSLDEALANTFPASDPLGSFHYR